MRMSAVMAQLENSSVSPTKIQICPGEKRATVRRPSTHQQPEAAPCTLAAGRESQSPPWGLHLLAVRLMRNVWLIKPCPQP